MKYASVTDRVAALGGAKWELHLRAKAMLAAGRPVIMLSIGEPDTPPPSALLRAATEGIAAGRTGYSNGRGEPGLLAALAAKYTARSGRAIGTEQILCLPGTQTALFAILSALVEHGDEVLTGDPMYATYESVIAATGARMVSVPLRPEHGFRMQAADVVAALTPQSRVLFLNTPHNPTGAVLTPADIAALGEVARAHDLWILSDEVYEEMVFPGATFVSPLSQADLADRVIVAASISKTHAAPGFRSGWCVGPAEFAARLLPLAESMLFGNQPFIADMTALAVSAPSTVAPGMVARFSARAARLGALLNGVAGLRVNQPEAGMFALLDVRATGLDGVQFCNRLLEEQGVATMPGESFGTSLGGWVRLSLTQPDEVMEKAAGRIAEFARSIRGQSA